ncbi:MAG: signal peptidase I [Wujia sp.]
MEHRHSRRRRLRRLRNSHEFSFRRTRASVDVRKLVKKIFNWFVLVLAAAILGYAFVTFCFQTVNVTGPSMENVLSDGQVVVVNKLTYKFNDIKRFDIVAYSDVKKSNYYDIKRIIGLPGETLQIIDGDIYIDGEKLGQDVISANILNSGIAAGEITLGEDEYFVLGDNVNNSEDSRFLNVGNINKKEILGKVIYITKPKSARGKIE